ncbi:hypothetical protein BH11PSE9_BH11PSE9_03580 [soil metagenome]
MPSHDALFSSPALATRHAEWTGESDRREARLWQQRVLSTLVARLRRPLVGPEATAASIQRVYAAELVFHHRLELWRFDYSTGVSLPQLSEDLCEVICAYSLWRWLFDRLASRRSPSSGVHAPGDLRDAIHYRDFLQLLSLCRLFGLEDHIPALVTPQLNRAGMDVLLAALARLPLTDASGAPRWPDAPPAFRLLQHALLAPDPAGDRHAVEAYCDAPPDARGDASVLQGTDWAFEAAALCTRGTARVRAERWPRDLAGARRPTPGAPGTKRRSTDGQPAIAGLPAMFPLQTSVRPSSDIGRRIAAAVAVSLALGDTARAMAPTLEMAPAAPVVERGWASWYGPGFQERPTASGERYDMHWLTAAHRTLPLPSYVHVRNLRNNRQAVVVVNDRGPYIDGRVIDVSLAAAEQLEMVAPGVVEVEITVLTAEQVSHWVAARPAELAVAATRPVPVAGVAHLGGLAALAGAPAQANTAGAMLPASARFDEVPSKPGSAPAPAPAPVAVAEGAPEPDPEPAAQPTPNAPAAVSDEPVLTLANYRPEALAVGLPAAPILCAAPAAGPPQPAAADTPQPRVKPAVRRQVAPKASHASSRRSAWEWAASMPISAPIAAARLSPKVSPEPSPNSSSTSAPTAARLAPPQSLLALTRAAATRPTATARPEAAAASPRAEPRSGLLARVEALGRQGWRGLVGALGFGG